MDGKVYITGDASQLQSEMQKAADSAAGFNSAAGKSFAGAAEGADRLNFATAGARRELIVLAHEAATGNWTRFAGSMMILGERTDALKLIFSSTGVAIASVLGVIGAFAVAAIKGSEESKQFANNMRLTGDYAGVTEGQFRDLARQISGDTSGSLGKAREALAGLISTGQFTGPLLREIGDAAVTMSKLTGKSIDDSLKELEKMTDGVARWAYDANLHYHFLSAAQYEHIRLLEEQGDKQQAMIEVTKALNTALGQEAPKQLSIFSQAWHSVEGAASKAWDAMLGIGRDTTVEDKIEKTESALANLRAHIAEIKSNPHEYNQSDADVLVRRVQEYETNLTALQKQQAEERARVAKKSEDDQHQQSLIDAQEYMRKLHQTIGENLERRNEMIAEYNKKADLLGLSDGQRKTDIAAINAKFKDRKPHEESKTGQFEAELSEMKLAAQEKAQVENTFYQESKADEQKFWQEKLQLVDAGSKDALAIRKKIADLGTSMRKDDFEAEQESLKVKIASAKNSYTEQEAAMAKFVQNARQYYGQDSKEYQASLKAQEEMRLEHEAKMREIDTLRRTSQRAYTDYLLQEGQQQAQLQEQLGLITKEQLLQIQAQYIAQKEALDLADADAEVAKYNKGTLEYEKALAKRIELKQKYDAQLSGNKNSQVLENLKPQTNIFDSLQSNLQSNLTGMLTKAKSWQQAIGGIFQSVGTTFVQEMVTKPMTQWIGMWVRKLALNLGFLSTQNTQDAAAASTGATTAINAATTKIAANAAVAGSGAASSQASIPYVGPILAVAAMAAIFAAVMGMSGKMKSAAGGFDIPAGMNPVVQTHAEEMILPKTYANGLRNLIESGGTNGGGHTIHYHDHSGRLSDSDIQRNASKIARALKSHVRNGGKG